LTTDNLLATSQAALARISPGVVPSLVADVIGDLPGGLAVSIGGLSIKDIRERDFVQMSTERTELENYLKTSLSRVIRERDIRLPRMPRSVVNYVLDNASNRTRNGLLRCYGSQAEVNVRSIQELLRVRNFGINCVLDFLRQLDKVPPSLWLDPFDAGAAASRASEDERAPVRTPFLSPARIGDDAMMPAVLLLRLISGKDARKLRILIARMFRDTEPIPTLQEIALTLGITRERVRQIESAQERRVSEALSHPVNVALRRALDVLSQFLGAVSEREAASRAVHDALHVPHGNVLPDEAVIFAFYLAGYYERDARWVFRGTLRDAMQQVITAVMELADGSLEPEKAVSIAATRCDIPRAFIAEVLNECGVSTIGGRLFRRLANYEDRIEALFRVMGNPLSAEELCRGLGCDQSLKASILNRVIADRRFHKTDVARYALAEWGLPRYTTIVSAIREAVEVGGGGANLSALARDLSNRFGVSATSVQTYAHASPFLVDQYGVVKLADVGHVTSRRNLREPERERQLFQHDGVWYLRVKITQDVMRGVGVTTSAVAADLAGVRRGEVFTKLLDGFEIAYRWTQTQPYVSTLRAYAESRSVAVGDLIFLSLSPDENITSFCVMGTTISSSRGLQRLSYLCGVTTSSPSGALLTEISRSVGMAEEPNVAAVREVFVERRDREALSLLPVQSVTVEDDPMEDLLAMLG